MDHPVDDRLLAAETLTDKAYRALEEEIVTLRIPPGTVVSEAMLSQRLGVGRTPVREALQRLAREWLVVILPRRGIVVSEIDPVRHLRLLEVRREVERLLARSAARRASAPLRARFRTIAEAMDERRTLCRRHRLHAAGPGRSTCCCWRQRATSSPRPP